MTRLSVQPIETDTVELVVGDSLEDPLRIRVSTFDRGDAGVLLQLAPVNCDLDGDEPGSYYLTRRPAERVSP